MSGPVHACDIHSRLWAAMSCIAALILLGEGAAAGGTQNPAGPVPAMGTVAPLPSPMTRGGTVVLQLTITNNHRLPTVRSTARAYLSRDSRWGSSDVLLAPTIPTPAISPEKTRSRNVVVTIPARTAKGRWALLMCVDESSGRSAGKPGTCSRLRGGMRVIDPPSLREVEGGPGYYGRFSNALPTSPSDFPVGVWFESVSSQSDINLDKDAGLNLYVGMTSNSNLGLVRSNGMRAIIQSDERTKFTGVGSETVGWELHDEMDMQCGPPNCDGYGRLNQILAGLPDDGRARYNNYGKGVMFWHSDQDAARWVNEFNQLVSNDIYWFTDPGVCVASEGGLVVHEGIARSVP